MNLRDLYFLMAGKAYKEQDYKKAAELYQEALKYKCVPGGLNTDALCYSNLGMALSGYGDYLQAYLCLKKAQSLGLNNLPIERELRWLKDNAGIG